ncbi:hypothetical protein QJS63_29410 (plasmid) [Pseudomonas juntendi]|nr:hypothetical protein QJS63_29410 [Pseudomonas juntendi]
MSDEKIPDRIKAKLTIELDFAKEDQPLIGEVLQASSITSGSPVRVVAPALRRATIATSWNPTSRKCP